MKFAFALRRSVVLVAFSCLADTILGEEDNVGHSQYLRRTHDARPNNDYSRENELIATGGDSPEDAGFWHRFAEETVGSMPIESTPASSPVAAVVTPAPTAKAITSTSAPSLSAVATPSPTKSPTDASNPSGSETTASYVMFWSRAFNGCSTRSATVRANCGGGTGVVTLTSTGSSSASCEVQDNELVCSVSPVTSAVPVYFACSGTTDEEIEATARMPSFSSTCTSFVEIAFGFQRYGGVAVQALALGVICNESELYFPEEACSASNIAIENTSCLRRDECRCTAGLASTCSCTASPGAVQISNTPTNRPQCTA